MSLSLYKCSSLIFFLAPLLLSTMSHAVIEGEVRVGYEIRYDDNINLGTENSGIEENLSNEFYSEVDLQKRDGFFRYDALGSAGFIAETSDLIDDRWIIEGIANAEWIISKNRLMWDFYDSASIRRRNSARAFSAINSEQVNRFRTGPRLYFRPGAQTNLNLSTFYEYAWFEFDNDNEYIGIQLDANRQLNERTGLTFTAAQTNFEPSGRNRSDEVNRSIFLSMDRKLQNGNMVLGAGLSQVELDIAQATETEKDGDPIPTFRGVLDYRLSTDLTMAVIASHSVISVGRDEYNRVGSDDLVEQYASNSPSQSNFDVASVQSELDDFDYTAGFNEFTRLSWGLTYDKSIWALDGRIYKNIIDVPEIQVNLSEDAQRAYFAGQTGFELGSESVGFLLTLRFQPKLRWLASVSYSVENRLVDRQRINGEEAGAAEGTLGAVDVVDIQDRGIFANVSFAASRYLSFGSRLEIRNFDDEITGSLPVKTNRISFNVEYSL